MRILLYQRQSRKLGMCEVWSDKSKVQVSSLLLGEGFITVQGFANRCHSRVRNIPVQSQITWWSMLLPTWDYLATCEACIFQSLATWWVTTQRSKYSPVPSNMVTSNTMKHVYSNPQQHDEACIFLTLATWWLATRWSMYIPDPCNMVTSNTMKHVYSSP